MDKINLTKLPTPLHAIRVDDKNRYFIKRDDLTDFALGGNKARKMEYFLADILNKRCNYIVTYGSLQSNHCRIVASAAARQGIKCLLILEDSKYESNQTGNNLFYYITGANIRFTSVDSVSRTIEDEMQRLRESGFNPYFIPGGGHGNLGTHAYFKAYEEIREQSCKFGLKIDYIFLASGTGTTQSGLIAGKEIYDGEENIIGISIARKTGRATEVVRESLESYYKELYNKNKLESKDIVIDDSFTGAGYADIYKEVGHTIQSMLCQNSIVLDPVYTGKAFYGMREYIKREQITDKNILFIHTGGTPIFFSKGNEVINILNS